MDYSEISSAVSRTEEIVEDINKLNKNLTEEVLVSNTSDFSSLTSKVGSVKTAFSENMGKISTAVENMKSIEEDVSKGVV